MSPVIIDMIDTKWQEFLVYLENKTTGTDNLTRDVGVKCQIETRERLGRKLRGTRRFVCDVRARNVSLFVYASLGMVIHHHHHHHHLTSSRRWEIWKWAILSLAWEYCLDLTRNKPSRYSIRAAPNSKQWHAYVWTYVHRHTDYDDAYITIVYIRLRIVSCIA